MWNIRHNFKHMNRNDLVHKVCLHGEFLMTCVCVIQKESVLK